MLSALLLPLLLAGAPSAGQSDDPAVQLWISNDRRFLPGDRAKVHVRAEDDGFLLVLHADPDGHLRVLFPLDPDDDNFVRGGKRYEIRDRGGREAFDADRTGRGMVYAAVARAPFRFDGYVLGDHWDYRALAPDRLPRDPETELTELVRRMAGGSFDYDVLSYDVLERVVYASSSYSYSRPYYSSSYYDDPWCSGYWSPCGSGLHIGISFGRPYRAHYYSPYWYGYHPYYDPFFYDPYYYRPAYYYPVYRYYPYRSSYYPRYRDWRYDHRYRHSARPYTPYRFRGSEGVQTDFRDRNYGFRRAVNTVYTPPVTRFAEPERSSPVRRVADVPDADRPIEARREATRGQVEPRREATRREPAAQPDRGRVEPRREATGREPAAQPQRGQVEARRAREREPERGTMRDAREQRNETLPQEIRGRRATEDRTVDADRPSVNRAPLRPERAELPEARPTRRADDRPSEVRAEPRPAPRAEPRAEPRSAPRVERSSPPPSSPSSGGGRRPSGGGEGGGGGRRR